MKRHIPDLGFSPSARKEMLQKLNLIFDYIDDHLTEDISLETIADVAGFSKFHFSRLFKQYSGVNFYNYLSHKRLTHAEALLAHSRNSITEIALQCGFSSLSTFNRVFKKSKNCTPSEYRVLQRNSITHLS